MPLLRQPAGLTRAAEAAAGDAAKKPAWPDTAEFGYVQTSGNTETRTLGLKNTFAHEWERQRFEFKVGGIRVETVDRGGRGPL